MDVRSAPDATGPDMPEHPALPGLRRLLGQDGVLTDLPSRTLYSQDVFRRGRPVLAVLRPANVEDVASTVKACADAGLAIVPRGGGMSYTDGYVPIRPDSVSLDLSRLDRILSIDETDMTVTVEAGVTWAALRTALAAKGLRTPYWGPMSGLHATVGGALSQGSIFFGSAQHGAVADSVLSIAVVTGDGTLLETGVGGNHYAETPFFRWHGPDLTGLFCGDAGALGIKVRATFRLLKLAPVQEHLSFGFDDYAGMAAALAAIAREGVCSEIAAFDPHLARLRMKRASLMADVGALGALVKARGSLLKGMTDAARVAVAGRRFMDGVEWSVHCALDGLSAAALEPAVEKVRAAVAAAGGREIENTIAKMMRAMPFPPPNSMVAPGGERWVPVHGIVPLSKMRQSMDACEKVFADHDRDCRTFGIEHGYLMTTVATHAYLIEPCLYWPDATAEIHHAFVEADYLRRVPTHPPNPDAFAAVDRIRQALADALAAVGGTHFQLGKFYAYADNLHPANLAALKALKAHFDPAGVLNPGALGI